MHAEQDEARKALQGIFKGQKDLLAAYDADSGSGGNGKGGGKKFTGGGGGPGNGGSGWQMPDFRSWIINAWKRLGRSLRALLAVFGFVGGPPPSLSCCDARKFYNPIALQERESKVA